MNQKSRNEETDQNVPELMKRTSWKKYSVKRFPYYGRRRYTPLVYQSKDEGIFISNDVFGMTIKQFERSYKDCLDRRKTREQYILNLRYPDKTSDEYLEYLEIGIDCNKDDVSLTGNELNERYLYQHLVNTAGTEIDIRNRQQLFITKDMIRNANIPNITCISSGSLAEGLDLPGSDIDIMYVIEDVDIIRDVKNIKYTVQPTTLVIESDNDYPGFARLRLIAGGKFEFMQPECFESTNTGLYLLVDTFASNIHNILHNFQFSSHGPCLSDEKGNVDFAFCLRSKYLPHNTIPWTSRHRLQWPPNSVIDNIKKYGCLLVPIGPRTLPDCKVLWRLSFSVAEKRLVHSFNYIQMLCYCLLKLTLRHIVNKDANELLCSYFLKTAVFWVSEENDIDTFRMSKLYFCFSLCLSKLILWVKNCYCPNYFIPEQNMFVGKIYSYNNTILLNVLYGIKREGIDGLIHNIYQHDKGGHRLLSTQLKSSFIMLDLFFYRISHIGFFHVYDISNYLKLLKFIEYLLKSKSCTFIADVCKWHYAQTSQFTAQQLPSPTVNTERYNIHKRYHRHLQDGIKTDAVSGWLLYASFYYLTGQFNVTLKLTDYVLSRCSNDMVHIGCQNYEDRHINYYKNNVHSTMTLLDKMRMTVVNNVMFLKQSSLIPKELQQEVKDSEIFIPPIVMSHCLRFLCYHHIGDMSNRQQALRDLYSTVTRAYLIGNTSLSNAITILGVCFEISDDKDTAYLCYEVALKCGSVICGTAEARRSKLLTDII